MIIIETSIEFIIYDIDLRKTFSSDQSKFHSKF